MAMRLERVWATDSKIWGSRARGDYQYDYYPKITTGREAGLRRSNIQVGANLRF